jgi:hypothetical protein
MYVMENGFVLQPSKHKMMKLAIESEVEGLVEKVGKDPDNILKAYNKSDTLAFPVFTKEIVKLLVPERLRHLIFKSLTHDFGKKEFNVLLLDSIKRELCVFTSFFFSKLLSSN